MPVWACTLHASRRLYQRNNVKVALITHIHIVVVESHESKKGSALPRRETCSGPDPKVQRKRNRNVVLRRTAPATILFVTSNVMGYCCYLYNSSLNSTSQFFKNIFIVTYFKLKFAHFISDQYLI